MCECCDGCEACYGDLFWQCCDCVGLCGMETKKIIHKAIKPKTIKSKAINFKLSTFKTNLTDFKVVKKTNNSICFENVNGTAPCTTLYGCNYCLNHCKSVGFGWSCCHNSHYCCYDGPAYCSKCNGRNDCTCIYHKC